MVKSLKSSSSEEPAQVQKLVNVSASHSFVRSSHHEFQLLNRQAHVWGKLRHPNVLPFLGLYEVDQATPILVSPFCEFGHVGHYVRNHSQANRIQLVVDFV